MGKQKFNIALKVAIVQSGKTSQEVARSARIPETRLSHIVRLRITPTAKERERIAKAVARDEGDLFPTQPDEAVAS